MNVFKLSLILILSTLVLWETKAQSYRIEGFIKDQDDSSSIIGAVIYLKHHKQIGTVSDENGYFLLDSPSKNDVLIIENIGHSGIEIPLKEFQSQGTVFLRSIAHQEVIVEGNAYREKLESTQMSTVTLSSKDAKLLPALLGEVDLLKTLQLKPGVQSGGEGSTGIYVRGGGPDQNLFLINGTTVYNPNHLFGFFSIFNADAVRDITLYKGGFPARYGGRLSSVIDVQTNDGDSTKHSVNGGIGLISSRLSISGPIVKGKLWGNISFRRTYADVFTRMINRMYKDKEDYSPIPDYYFYDANLQLNYQVNTRNLIRFTGYLGRDKFNFLNRNIRFDFKWGNTLGGLSWNSIIDSNTTVNTTLSVSDYTYTLENKTPTFGFRLFSGILDYNLKSSIKKKFKRHIAEAGIEGSIYRFNISRLKAGTSDGQIDFTSGDVLRSTGGGVFINDEFKIRSRWLINAGLRWSWFQKHTFYHGFEPRIQGNYRIAENTRIKASYSRMYQYIHLVSNSGASLPTDIWYPSNANVKPQLSDQVALGYEFSFLNSKLFFGNELYYKTMSSLVDFRDGAQLFINDSLDQEFVFGRGESYGTEFYLEKKRGKTRGWIGYTLSWTNRKFTEINNGKWFPARYDRRHDLSVVIMHQLSKRFSCSGTFVYGTGQAVSLPIGRFVLQDVDGQNPGLVPVYTERNAFRLPDYHRMDASLIYHLKPKWGEADLTLSVYNVYNRRNTYFIYFEEKKDANGIPIQYVAKQVSLFPIIPSLTFNFKW